MLFVVQRDWLELLCSSISVVAGTVRRLLPRSSCIGCWIWIDEVIAEGRRWFAWLRVWLELLSSFIFVVAGTNDHRRSGFGCWMDSILDCFRG